jgi:hypothetical protein
MTDPLPQEGFEWRRRIAKLLRPVDEMRILHSLNSPPLPLP